jgi:hypothetical protein
MREACFLPLEIIRSATMAPGRVSRKGDATGCVVRVGMLADLVIVPENPLSNLKVPTAPGMRLNPQTNRQEKWRVTHRQGRHRLRRAEAAGGSGGGSRRREAHGDQHRGAAVEARPRCHSVHGCLVSLVWQRCGITARQGRGNR